MAEYLKLFVACAMFWAVMAFGLTVLSNDDMFTGTEINASGSITDGANVNITTSTDTELSASGFKDSGFFSMMVRLFGFRLYNIFDMPVAMSFVISLINYILFIIGVICAYKLLNPFSSG